MPNLYLPIMEECNRRSLEPWRKFLPTPEWFAHRKRVAMLNAYIIDMIRARWKKRMSGVKNPNPDILDRVLASVDEDEYGAEVERQMCFEIKTFLLAGHETSAAMLIWTTWELVNNEEKMKKAVDEAKRVFAEVKPGALPTRKQLDKLDYNVSALKESLRLYSVVPEAQGTGTVSASGSLLNITTTKQSGGSHTTTDIFRWWCNFKCNNRSTKL